MISVKKVTVHCDECGWEDEIPDGTLQEWTTKNCPSCGKGPVVSEESYQSFVQQMKIIEMFDEMLGVDEDDPNGEHLEITLTG